MTDISMDTENYQYVIDEGSLPDHITVNIYHQNIC